MAASVTAWRYALPLRQPLLTPGSAQQVRHGLLLSWQQDDQPCRWAEAAPLAGFSTETLAAVEQSLPHLAAALTAAPSSLAAFPLPASLAFAVSCLQQTSLYESPATPLAHCYLLAHHEAINELAHIPYAATLKVKVGQHDWEHDQQRLIQLAQRRPDLRLRIDANRQWSPDYCKALFAYQHLAARIDYFEEPCASLAMNVQLAKAGLPIALDESLRDPAFSLSTLPWLQALVLKPTLLGALPRLQQWVDAAHQQQVEVVVSSSFESPVGLFLLAQLAQRWSPTTAPGLDTLRWFQTPYDQPLAPDLFVQRLTSSTWHKIFHVSL